MSFPSLTVAAVNTPDTVRRDLSCDGVNDEQDVLQAIKDTDHVVLLGGTYQIDASTQPKGGGVLTLDRGVQISGQGPSTVLNFKTGQGLPDRYMLGVCGQSDYACTGWAIKDLQINCHDPQHHAIRVWGSGGGTMDNVVMSHDQAGGASTDEGIQYTDQVAANRGDHVSNIRIQGFGASGIELFANTAGTTDCEFQNIWLIGNANGFKFRGDDSKLRRNHLRGVRAYAGSGSGFQLNAGTDNSLDQCTAYGNAVHGFSFGGPADDMRRFALTTCVAESNGRNGFDVAGERHRFIGCSALYNGQDPTQPAGQRAGFRSTSGMKSALFVSCYAYGDPLNQQRGFLEVGDPAGGRYISCDASGHPQDWVLGWNASVG